MNDKLTEQQTADILKALDEAIEQGPWEASNFLKVIGKNLREIRENYLSHIQAHQDNKEADDFKNKPVLSEGCQEVYVSLYSSDGSNMQNWEKILTNLPRQIISRPIYAEERQVTQLIKSKLNKLNEAYVAIYINSSDILPMPADKTPYDKLGQSLLVLKDRSIKLDNITRFVHLTGVYSFRKGLLRPDS